MSEKLKEILKNHLENKQGWWTGLTSVYINDLVRNRKYPMEFDYSGIKFYIDNPSIEFQKMIIREAKYSLDAILFCSNLEDFDEEFEQEIFDNLMIKDIIE